MIIMKICSTRTPVKLNKLLGEWSAYFINLFSVRKMVFVGCQNKTSFILSF